jgi:hypothetical protein
MAFTVTVISISFVLLLFIRVTPNFANYCEEINKDYRNSQGVLLRSQSVDVVWYNSELGKL